jgi:hypothetical protein
MKKREEFIWIKRRLQQAEKYESKRARSQEVKLSKLITSLFALFVLCGLIATVLLFIAINDTGATVVDAIKSIDTIYNPQASQHSLIEYRPVPNISNTASFATCFIAAFLTLVFYLFQKYFAAQRNIDEMKYTRKLERFSHFLSIFAFGTSLIFGIISIVQAAEQIKIATTSNDITANINVGVFPATINSQVGLIEIAKIGPFASGEPLGLDLPAQLAEFACEARKKIHKIKTSSIIVVGRHDRRGFQSQKLQDSNAALAQRRAEAVVNHFRNGNCNNAPIGFAIVTLVGGPKISGLLSGNEAEDREVVIYAISNEEKQ